MHRTTVKDPADWQKHRGVVRALGGPAAVRAALATVGAHSNG